MNWQELLRGEETWRGHLYHAIYSTSCVVPLNVQQEVCPASLSVIS